MLPTEIAQFDERLGESDLDDLLDLAGAVEVSGRDAGDVAFVPVKELLEGVLVPGDDQIDQLSVCTQCTDRPTRDDIVTGTGRQDGLSIEGFRDTAHPRFFQIWSD